MWGGFWFGYMLGSERNNSSNSESSGVGGIFSGILILLGLFFIYKVAHFADSRLIYAANHSNWVSKVFFPYILVVFYDLKGTEALKMCVYAILGCLLFLFLMYRIQYKMSHSARRKMFNPSL